MRKCVEFINKIWLAIVWLFSKLNQAIQWTKKYWLFHCMVWLSLHYLIFISSLPFEGCIYKLPTYVSNIYEILTINCIFYLWVPISIMLIIKIMIATFISIIIYLKTKTFLVKSDFLLFNKYYNVYYILTILSAVIFYISVIFKFR